MSTNRTDAPPPIYLHAYSQIVAGGGPSGVQYGPNLEAVASALGCYLCTRKGREEAEEIEAWLRANGSWK